MVVERVEARLARARRGRDADLDELVRDPDKRVRKEVAYIGRDKDLDILVYDEDWTVRLSVAYKCRPKDAIILLHDENHVVRHAYADELAYRDDSWALQLAAGAAREVWRCGAVGTFEGPVFVNGYAETTLQCVYDLPVSSQSVPPALKVIETHDGRTVPHEGDDALELLGSLRVHDGWRFEGLDAVQVAWMPPASDGPVR